MPDVDGRLPRRVVVSREVRKRQAAPGRVSDVITNWLPWADDATLVRLAEAVDAQVKSRRERAFADRLAAVIAAVGYPASGAAEVDERERTRARTTDEDAGGGA